MEDTGIRVRFAPSPTGRLHVGGARTALYNWAFARRHGGTFILRIDDTDPERSTVENTEAILRALEWLSIDWDEGPEVGGDHGPYLQTERADLYADALRGLQDAGAAYPCFCTPDELARMRDAQRKAGGSSGYDRTCRSIAPDEAAARIDAGEPHVWRLKVPEGRGEVAFDDAVRGITRFPADAVDDLVLFRTDGTPTYNLATAVDDARMGITHVIRGDDHLSNTPKQILVLEALGEEVPTFAHLSMILGPDGKRLSKRHGATSVEAFREEGILPEALVNYLVLLGWSLDDKTTVMDTQTIVHGFSLDRISRNPAVFDPEKLLWLNGVYIREMSDEDLGRLLAARLWEDGLVEEDDFDRRPGFYAELASMVSERLKRVDEVTDMVRLVFVAEIEIEEKARRKVLEKEGAADSLRAAEKRLAGLEGFDAEHVERALREVPEELGVKPRVAFQSVRVAITGTTVSPPLFESIALLGREATLDRIRRGTELASTP